MKAPHLSALAGALILTFMNTHASELPDAVTVRLVEANGEPGSPQSVPSVRKTDDEWKNQLGAKAYEVLRAKGTEPAFCGNPTR